MLLHGAPGVGKTATAEAVADVSKKPLFPITCGDLGMEPNEVEANLTEIFRLANVWDCILLLDEAEIFLSPRAKRDDNLQRNALVSNTLLLYLSTSTVIALTQLSSLPPNSRILPGHPIPDNQPSGCTRRGRKIPGPYILTLPTAEQTRHGFTIPDEY